MSVIVIGRLKADPAKMKQAFSDHKADFLAVAEVSRPAGAKHHMFAAGDGEVLVIDEWDSAESFQKFFESQAKIGEIMQAIGVEGPPAFEFFELLDSPDQY